MAKPKKVTSPIACTFGMIAGLANCVPYLIFIVNSANEATTFAASQPPLAIVAVLLFDWEIQTTV